MTMTAITTVNSPIKYRNSIYSKNGICNEKKQKTKNTKENLRSTKLETISCRQGVKTMHVAMQKLAS
jgi:hypothetical protein